MKLYVGNLDREVTKEDLTEFFKPFGELGEVIVIRDRVNNVSKGFGFVEMPNKEEAEAAITGLKGKPLKGRNIDVNEARPKTDAPRKSFGGGGGYGGGGGRRGGGGGNRY
ncbi:MAG: RNA-binding protein [Ignavibacteriales bacterium]|nr:RNA-binding protein [Ignavibacteriales bacterium]